MTDVSAEDHAQAVVALGAKVSALQTMVFLLLAQLVEAGKLPKAEMLCDLAALIEERRKQNLAAGGVTAKSSAS